MPRRKGSGKIPPTREMAVAVREAEAVKRELRRALRRKGLAESEAAARLGFSRSFFPNLCQAGSPGQSPSLRMEVFLAVATLVEEPADELLQTALAQPLEPEAPQQLPVSISLVEPDLEA
ncbi:MAG TPA: hypothetical protein PK413_08915, partial [Thermoanaerobaculia bacterium]|nr:hypothetical protein [Thermoanaerobaculia bacterium]